MACVNVASFPLQLLLRDHPDWTRQPVAVVEDDRPQSPVLSVNAHARRLGVRIGQRYATALTLALNLHAGSIASSQIDHGVRTLADRLRRYSPHVEPSSDTPGVFWLDASGLRHLYPSLHAWADLIRADLQQTGMIAAVAVGFSRFGAYALAISHRGAVVCSDASEERARVQRVPLSRLNLDPDARDRLIALGIETVGDFLRLPGDGIRARFGTATDALYQLAAGTRWAPIVPTPAPVRYQCGIHFDEPENNVERLVFVIKRRLDVLVKAAARVSEAIVEVVLHMKLDDRAVRVESVKPAASTLDAAQLLTLVRLRLETLQLSGGIVTLRVSANTCPATSDQRGLLPDRSRRDAEAANQALARLRAECGEENVVRARIRDAHLPSARFAWEPITSVPEQATPRIVPSRPLVRRIYTKPVPLSEWSDMGTHPEIPVRDRARPTRSGTMSDSAKPAWRERQRARAISAIAESRGGVSSHAARTERTVSSAVSVEAAGPVTHRDFGMDDVERPQPVALSGPYIVSGGWWGGGVRRDYYFVHINGEMWWVYFDHRRQRFFLQGKVE